MNVEFSVVLIIVINVSCISRAMSVAFSDLEKSELLIYDVEIKS